MAERSAILFDQKMARFRHRALNDIRCYFNESGFIELETPHLLMANAPDPYIDPILVTTAAGGARSYQLHTSPEIWLKRGLALGLERVYGLARVFRDDPLDTTHSKEFTMLEWYRTGADLGDLINDCASIFARAHAALTHDDGDPKKCPPFLYAHLNDLCKAHINLDLSRTLALIAGKKPKALQEQLTQLGDRLPDNASFSEAFSHILCKYIEPNLPQDQPVILMGWPAQMAALAQLNEDDPLYCDRFEIYFRGLEIANAYQECNDPHEITRRFNVENQERRKLGKPSFPIDQAFIDDLSKLSKTAGIALGIDRLLMATAQKPNIKQVQLGS